MKYRSHIRSEQGVALIVVLGVVSLFAILSAMLITASKIAGVSSKVNVDRSRGKYQAESFTAYAQWMIICFNFANAAEGIQARDEHDFLWVVGGKIKTHEFPDGSSVDIEINNVKQGDDIRELRNLISRRMQSTEDDDLRDIYTEFQAVYSDYIDRDNQFRSHPEYGMENEDYEDFGLENFPRNGNLQFREEMYWIRNIEYWIRQPSNLKLNVKLPENWFRALAPPGIRNPHKVGTRQDARSVTLDYLRTSSSGNLDESELREFDQCRKDETVRDEQSLLECLDVELAGKLRQYVDFKEDSAVVTLEVTAHSANGDTSRLLVSTINLRDLPNQTGSSDVGAVQTLPYWQKIFY